MHAPSPGTVIHWRDYLLTHGKYLLLLGECDRGLLLALTITTQEHWLRLPTHKAAMIEIPQGATTYLKKRSYINCFEKLERISPIEYEQAEFDGEVSVCGKLRLSYLAKVRLAIDNDLMVQADIADAVAAIDRAVPRK
jgi:hypothetical protein